ncbi:MAG: ABC transporter permease [Elusimicrobia bacterium]|nr:ABC transporter permease [Elusimicrobiota bacterium]
MSRTFLAAETLWKREIVRFYRQKSRVIGAIVPPLLFWFLIGSGFSRTLYPVHDLSSLQYFFPGMILMIVLFTSIFSTISIIEDRKEGFLQSVLVAPVPRISIVLGKVLGGASLAFLQGSLFILLAPFLGIHWSWLSFATSLLTLFLISFGLTGLGFCVAWQMDSTQGFHSIINLLLMPLWFLSGSLFPMEGAPSWLHGIMLLNPLTYSVSLLKYGFYSTGLAQTQNFPQPLICFFVLLTFDLAVLILSTILCSRPLK